MSISVCLKLGMIKFFENFKQDFNTLNANISDKHIWQKQHTHHFNLHLIINSHMIQSPQKYSLSSDH